METPGTITATQLCALTGLTDRRHRQLAQGGHFPAPIKGVYLLAPTVRGLFDYYRCLNDNDIKRKKTEEEHRKLKLLNDHKEAKLIPVQVVKESVGRILARVDQILEAKLSNEYPSAVAGMDVPKARTYGKRLGDQIRAEMQKLASEWKAK